jgi:hypothetical protein
LHYVVVDEQGLRVTQEECWTQDQYTTKSRSPQGNTQGVINGISSTSVGHEYSCRMLVEAHSCVCC